MSPHLPTPSFPRRRESTRGENDEPASFHPVIPAKAGIHDRRKPRSIRQPPLLPSFPGMTRVEGADSSLTPRVDSRLRGNDGVEDAGSSFSPRVDSRLRGNDGVGRYGLIACPSRGFPLNQNKKPGRGRWPYPGKVYIRKRSDPERGSPSCAPQGTAKPPRVRKLTTPHGAGRRPYAF